MPLVSVLIPTFNSEKCISNCLNSIIDQDFTDYEIVIKDGGSMDSTLKAIADISEAYPSVCIKVYSKNDAGIYDAMNQAVSYASGEWLIFLGSDDQLYNRIVFSDAHNCLTTSSAEFVYGNVLIAGDSLWAEHGKIYDGEFTREKLVVRNICHQSIFYRKSVFERIGYFNTGYTVAADWDFNHRCFAYCKVQFINTVVATFNAGGLSTHLNTDKFIEEDMAINLKKYYGISYYNKLFKSFSTQFLIQANKSLKKREIMKLSSFYLLALWHAQNKINFIKYSLLSIKKRIL